MIIAIKELTRNHEVITKNSGNPPRALVITCDGCGVEFERKWTKKLYDAKKHFCTLRCHYSHRGGAGGYGADVIETTCLSCGKIIRVNKTGHERKWGLSCSRKCYAQFRSQHPELYYQNTKAMHTAESWKKISDSAQKRMAEPDWVHPAKGKKLSEKACSNIAAARLENPPTGEKNGMFGRHHTDESRDKMSETRTRKMISGEIKSYGKNNHVSGNYISTKTGLTYRYRSSWERSVMLHLDSCCEVKTWSYESMRIPYINVSQRWYVPDFVVEFVDGRREVWEVKPAEFVSSRANLLKAEAAISFLRETGYSYFILTRDDLKGKGII